MDKLESLIEEYLKEYPKAENPFNYFETYGLDNLINILEARQGRKIIFIEEEQTEKTSYTYATQ